MLLVILLIEFLVALFDPGKDSGRLFTLLRGERFEQFAESQLCPMSCANVVGPSSGAVSVR